MVAPEKPYKPALLVVDMQEDFCPPKGALAVTDGRTILPTINALLALPFALKVATKDYHPPSHISFASSHQGPDNIPFKSTITITNPLNPAETQTARLWPDHCIQHTPGASLVQELDTSRIDRVVEKGQDPRVEMYSAFGDPFRSPSVSRSGLAETLEGEGVSDVFVVGLAMDYCVRYTARDAAELGFRTWIVQEATKAVDPAAWEEVRAELEGVGVGFVSMDGEELDKVREGLKR